MQIQQTCSLRLIDSLSGFKDLRQLVIQLCGDADYSTDKPGFREFLTKVVKESSYGRIDVGPFLLYALANMDVFHEALTDFELSKLAKNAGKNQEDFIAEYLAATWKEIGQVYSGYREYMKELLLRGTVFLPFNEFLFWKLAQLEIKYLCVSFVFDPIAYPLPVLYRLLAGHPTLEQVMLQYEFRHEPVIELPERYTYLPSAAATGPYGYLDLKRKRKFVMLESFGEFARPPEPIHDYEDAMLTSNFQGWVRVKQE